MEPLNLLQQQLLDIGRGVVAALPQVALALIILMVMLVITRLACGIIDQFHRRSPAA